MQEAETNDRVDVRNLPVPPFVENASCTCQRARACPPLARRIGPPGMCARRFLAAITILTLLVVAGAFAVYQFGGSVLLKTATPQGHFQPASAGDAPDYRNFDSWLCRPNAFKSNGTVVGNPDDPCLWRPQQIIDVLPSDAVFYIHPTTYLGRDRWNAPLHPGGDTEFRNQLFAQSQASAFNEVGRVWAPRYRQAAYGAFLLKSGDAEKALDFAYQDVAAAFDEFLRQAGDRPIILAAHSQGALHLERLLREKIAGKPIAKRVIAAYVVGWPISTAADLPELGLPACTSPQQTGCILSWMTFGDPPNPDLILSQWEKTKGLNGGDRRQNDILCVNPITGTQNGSGPHGVGGYLVPSADLRSATISYDAIGASCHNGLLMIGGALPNLGPYVLPGNNYHVYDYALFWGAIGGDAVHRSIAWFDKK